MLNQVQVVNPAVVNYPIGSQPSLSGGRQGEALVSSLHGKYLQHTLNGAMFEATQTSEAEFILDTAATSGLTLWNPSGSGKLVVPAIFTAGWCATTETPGNIEFAVLLNAGSQIATAAPFSAFTALTNRNMLLGSGNAPAARSATSAVMTTAGVVFMSLGWSHLTTTGASTGTAGWTNFHDFDGTVVIPPGNAIYPCASTASASTYNMTIVWYEIPLV